MRTVNRRCTHWCRGSILTGRHVTAGCAITTPSRFIYAEFTYAATNAGMSRKTSVSLPELIS
jgi:hypothetical protein